MGDEDVSAVGTLVWVRRPNGSWWPGMVVSPLEVPDCCPAPLRSPATPILRLGSRHGPLLVDWLNLHRSKRVKPFRCGDRGLQDCIRRAEQQHQQLLRSQTTACSAGTRYARKDDAVLQALHIERARLPTNPSHSAPADADAQPSTNRKRRKTPNDAEDSAPQRMKDLTDIGAPPKQTQTQTAPTASDLNRHLPSTSPVKRSKHSHHHHQDQQPCGASRKRDRSRPLSELCNGDIWKNGFTPNGHTTGSSSDTVLDTRSCSRRAAIGPVKAEHVDDVFPRPRGDDGPADTHLAATSFFKSDHLHVHQPCALTKAPTLECTKRASNCSKDDISSQCDSRYSKKRTTSSADHEGGTSTETASEREHRRERAVKQKLPSNEVVMFEKRVQKCTAADNKTATPDNDEDCAVIPNGLDHVVAVPQQHSESKCEHEEVSETISIFAECDDVPVPSVVFELPQVSLLQHRDPEVATCHAVKPIKTLHLNSPVYDVEIIAQGANSSSSSKGGGRVPLVSLMSRSSRRPVVGYPVSVEVLDDTAPCPPAPSIQDDCPSTSNNFDGPAKEEEAAAAAPQRESRAARAKAKSRKKASSEDEAWRPHTKNSNPATAASPRKMRRLSSLAPSQRRGGGDRRQVVTAMAGELCSRGGPALACVPLRLVFSRIHEALSHLGK